MSITLPMGTILPYALSTNTKLPQGWLFCDGREIPSKYTELIAALNSGYTPNLCGRTLVGAGTLPSSAKPQTDGRDPRFPSGFTLQPGDTGGEFAHELITSEIPSHAHSYSAMRNDIGSGYYQGKLIGYSPDGWWPLKENTPDHPSEKTGGDEPHFNVPPYQAVNFIILATP